MIDCEECDDGYCIGCPALGDDSPGCCCGGLVWAEHRDGGALTACYVADRPDVVMVVSAEVVGIVEI